VKVVRVALDGGERIVGLRIPGGIVEPLAANLQQRSLEAQPGKRV
jgi:hypothetical protein